MRQRGSALCCWCIALCLVAAASGRGLLISDQQAQKALDTVTSAAGDIFGQAFQALASSGVADSLTPWQRNHTIDAINQRAPEWKTDLGYFIRPQVNPVSFLTREHCFRSHQSCRAQRFPGLCQTSSAAVESGGFLSRLTLRCMCGPAGRMCIAWKLTGCDCSVWHAS